MRQELSERVRRLQQAVNANGLDSYLVSSEDNIWYLTNITYKPEERPFFVIISPKEKPVLVVPKLEEKHLGKIIIDCEIKSYWEYPAPEGSNWYDILQNTVKGFSRIGVEKSIKSEILSKVCAEEIVHIDLVDDMRKVKSPMEIQMIRNTAKISDQAMGKIFKNAYIGASVVEMFSLSKSIQTELIRGKAFDPIITTLLSVVWPAPKSAMPHSIPDLGDRLNTGPNVAMIYFRINGYAAECERTFFIGKPNKEDNEHLNHIMCARNKALSILKDGTKCSDVDAEAKEYLIKEGYGNNLLHRTGHGIGLKNHEKPWVAEGNDEMLKEI